MSQPARQSASGIVLPHPAKWHGRVMAWLTWALIRVVSSTLRYRVPEPELLEQATRKRPAILVTWHNRLALSLEVFNRRFRARDSDRRLAALVSASKDGGFLACILENFGVQPVRGSTSRRGPQALLELTTLAEKKFDIAITPDGPRGPKYKVQEGVMGLAQLTGLPIYPGIWNLSWKITVKSWDGFQIPLPFSRCEIRFGPPIFVARECSDEEREALRLRLERELLALTRE